MSDGCLQGATIGILGGGQLGRMLSVAAARLGYKCHVYEPGPAPRATWPQRSRKAPMTISTHWRGSPPRST